GAGTLRVFGTPRSMRRFGPRVRAAAFSRDGSAVAISHRRLVEVRDIATGAGRFAFRPRAPVRAVAVDARGDRVAVATIDGGVEVHGARGDVFAVRPPFKATEVSLDDRGRTVAAGGADRAAVWR